MYTFMYLYIIVYDVYKKISKCGMVNWRKIYYTKDKYILFSLLYCKCHISIINTCK